MALTPKQQKFVEEYLKDLNATQAAIRAGYSAKTAFSIGVENLKKPLIQEAIEGAISRRNERSEITQDRVLEELARIAFSDIKNIATWSDNGIVLEHSSDLSADVSAAIAEVVDTRTKTGGTVRVKMCSKEKALELLMRHMGMMRDKVDVAGDITIKILREIK